MESALGDISSLSRLQITCLTLVQTTVYNVTTSERTVQVYQQLPWIFLTYCSLVMLIVRQSLRKVWFYCSVWHQEPGTWMYFWYSTHLSKHEVSQSVQENCWLSLILLYIFPSWQQRVIHNDNSEALLVI